MLGQSLPAIATDEMASSTAVTDAFLVARAQRDPAAFAPLYDAYFDAIYRYCYHRLGSWDAAEDAASLVFINALTALPRYRAGSRSSSFRSWLFRIAHNVVANHHRASNLRPVRPLSDAGEVLDVAPSPEEEALTAEVSRSVHAVLVHLSPEQRRGVELRLVGLTDAEISQVLGRTRGAIRTTQYRAAIRIRALLAPVQGESHDA